MGAHTHTHNTLVESSSPHAPCLASVSFAVIPLAVSGGSLADAREWVIAGGGGGSGGGYQAVCFICKSLHKLGVCLIDFIAASFFFFLESI